MTGRVACGSDGGLENITLLFSDIAQATPTPQMLTSFANAN